MRAIMIAKSPLQNSVRHQCARPLTTTKMRFLSAPSIFQTALLVGWKGQRVANHAETFIFCNSVHPVPFGRNSATYTNSYETRAWFFTL